MPHAVILVYNPRSGTLLQAAEAAQLPAYFADLLAAHPHIQATLLPLDAGLDSRVDAAITAHAPAALWVAGGDGSVLAVARLARLHGLPLGVLPGGTMNLMARDLGMSLDLSEAVAQLADAQPTAIDMAEVNGQPYLCLSNIGMSTRLTQQREHLRDVPGWMRWPLMAGYTLKYLFAYPSMHIELDTGSTRLHLRTRSVSISNNPLDEEGSLIPSRPALDRGMLCLYVARDRSIWSLPRLVFRLLTGRWRSDPDLQVHETREARISFRYKRHTHVMCDGELERMRTPLHYRIHPGALVALRPRHTA